MAATPPKPISLTPPSVASPELLKDVGTCSVPFFGGSKAKSSLLDDDSDDEEDLAQPNRWPPFVGMPYDWTVPTTLIYRHAGCKDTESKLEYSPPFSAARAKLDYSHYMNPAMQRQVFQDTILTRVVGKVTERATRPCIVFTAGAVGAGKSYVLTQLYQRKLFPLDNFVKIDPDMIRQELPETAGYHEHKRNNMSSTSPVIQVQGEASQLTDILFEHSLLNNLSMLVDESFGDVNWFQQLLERLRDDYSHYRIVILYISADDAVIRQRSLNRAQKMGESTVLPDAQLQASIEQVSHSIMALQSRVETTVEISNNDNKALTLKLLHSNEDTNPVDWQWFAGLWGDDDNNSCQVDGSDAPMICNMVGAFEDPHQHESARSIWAKAYPNMCPRCAVACDGQCGLCIHKRHICACDICR